MKWLRIVQPKSLVVTAFALAIPLGIWAFTSFPGTSPNLMPIGYVAQDEVTNFNLKSAGGSNAAGYETLFRTEFNRENWSGDLHAYPIDSFGNLWQTERWSAASKLTTQTSTTGGVNGWDTGRFIATLSSATTPAGVAFRDPVTGISNNITVNATSSVQYTSAQVINYLRGDASNDDSHGGQLRTRTSPLGDIIHSRPLFVDDATNPTVFVGANDGMVHAFDADTGNERWAYIPSMGLNKIQKLAYNDSTGSNQYVHDYFVDGQLNSGTILKNGSPIRALFGGLGAGGMGLFALNINDLSNPTAESQVASKIMWEITPGNGARRNGGTSTGSYSHLGYTFGTPLLVKVNTTVGSTPSYVDALIVGNGYDDSANGLAHLYVIKAETGELMMDFVTPAVTGSTGSNGIFSPKGIDVNNDGYVDYVYGADLNGSLWKFDLSTPWVSTSTWSTPPARLFTNSTNGTTQPVTSSLGVAVHPNGGYMITFGTGSTLTGKYGVYSGSAWTTPGTLDMKTSSPDTYYVYGIWDGPYTTSTPITTANLQSQTITPRTYADPAGNTTRVRRSTATTPNWNNGTQRGWKVALPVGERIVGEGSFIENGRFYFNSYNPSVAPYLVPGTTTYIFGENWLMELNYLTGGSSASPFLDLDGNVLLNDNDRIQYISGDSIPTGKVAGNRILSPNEDGIPVGKFISTGVESQPILVQLATLNTTLINQNPDVIYPATTSLDRGVAGGHFDVDMFVPTVDCSPLGGTKASGSIVFNYNNNKTVTNMVITVGTEIIYSGSPGSRSASSLDDFIANATSVSANYSLTKNYGNGNNSSKTLRIAANSIGTLYNGAVTITATGLSSGDYTISNVANGSGGPLIAATSSTKCDIDVSGAITNDHVHQFDDQFDRTGVNFLHPSVATFNLSNVIPNNTTQFKVLLMNQYLNPSMMINIGYPQYAYTSTSGYRYVKNYQTSSGLQLSALDTYTMDTVGSLVLNFPVDAFSIKDWWSGSTSGIASTGEQRNGAMPTLPRCVGYGLNNPLTNNGSSASSINADMFNPVVPPANGNTGTGTIGTTTGARHNGAITIQIIRADTPSDALEQNISGRPEYGYRLKSEYYYTYVIAEYSMYWHHPRQICYGATGWTLNAPADAATANATAIPAAGAADPKIGALGQNSLGVTSIDPAVVVGNTSTVVIHYIDGTTTTIATTSNLDGTQTIVTTQRDSQGETIGTPTTEVVANAKGTVKTGGDERGLVSKTGRISWHELLRP